MAFRAIQSNNRYRYAYPAAAYRSDQVAAGRDFGYGHSGGGYGHDDGYGHSSGGYGYPSYGSSSTYGYKEECPGISIALLIVSLGGIGRGWPLLVAQKPSNYMDF